MPGAPRVVGQLGGVTVATPGVRASIRCRSSTAPVGSTVDPEGPGMVIRNGPAEALPEGLGRQVVGLPCVSVSRRLLRPRRASRGACSSPGRRSRRRQTQATTPCRRWIVRLQQMGPGLPCWCGRAPRHRSAAARQARDEREHSQHGADAASGRTPAPTPSEAGNAEAGGDRPRQRIFRPAPAPDRARAGGSSRRAWWRAPLPLPPPTPPTHPMPTSRRPSIEITTVVPANTTARPAEAMAARSRRAATVPRGGPRGNG